jgi:hypothetical protein
MPRHPGARGADTRKGLQKRQQIHGVPDVVAAAGSPAATSPCMTNTTRRRVDGSGRSGIRAEAARRGQEPGYSMLRAEGFR